MENIVKFALKYHTFDKDINKLNSIVNRIESNYKVSLRNIKDGLYSVSNKFKESEGREQKNLLNLIKVAIIELDDLARKLDEKKNEMADFSRFVKSEIVRQYSSLKDIIEF